MRIEFKVDFLKIAIIIVFIFKNVSIIRFFCCCCCFVWFLDSQLLNCTGLYTVYSKNKLYCADTFVVLNPKSPKV